MQLTIDIRDSAIDKIMYILDSLKADVKIIKKSDASSLDIERVSKNDLDYQLILNGRDDRKNNLKNYGSLDDIKWDWFGV